jgi:pimeloyl-ACP methyl ester carboxylesterase
MAKRVAVGSLEVEYDEVGAGERPFVLVHGFTGSRDDFADVLDPLAALGRTLVPDLRGHGGTTNAGAGYTFDQLTADLLGFLDATGAERCDLLGHSLGGMVALRFALAHPERLASLVLMDTAAREPDATPSYHRAIGFLGRRVPLRWFGRLVQANRRRLPEPMRRAEASMGSERYWERLRRKLDSLDPIGFGELMRAIAEQEPVSHRLHEIHCPTLVLVGEQDEVMRETSSELSDAIPDAKLVVVEGSHHSPQIEAQDEWLAAIREHLARARE